ncbi:MAG: pyridoxamine 5'-phosphate oxidase family protein [Acidobacteria bacterium]|nr:pyridoxamine 5'-phosphate oxidase family protein [Acidobacteriota bacterium]
MAKDWRGKIGGMDEERMSLYLSGSTLARVAMTDDGGRPYVMPLWYHWDGNAFWFVIRERSAIARFMRDRPDVSIVVDDMGRVDDPERGRHFEAPKVFAQGTAEIVEEPNIGGQWVAVAEEMAKRYLGPNGPAYIKPTIQQPRWLIKVTPDNVKTWEGLGWAKKYWVESDTSVSHQDAHAS